MLHSKPVLLKLLHCATLLALLPITTAWGGFFHSKSTPSREPTTWMDQGGLAGDLPQESGIDSTDRPRQDLAGTWEFRFDQDPDTAETQWRPMQIPGVWDLAFADAFNKQGVGWLRYHFKAQDLAGPDHRRVRLKFEAVFREAQVSLNGVQLGSFELPYLPFGFDVTSIVKPNQDNVLLVRIDNRITRDTIPVDTIYWKGRMGWFPYGGIIRPVYLEAELPCHVSQARIRTALDGSLSVEINGVRLDPRDIQTCAIDSWVETPEGQKIQIASLGVPQGSQFSVPVSGQVPGAKLWSPETPDQIYQLHIRTTEHEGVSEEMAYDFAFKKFEAKDGRFYLNGVDRYLKGINRHEDHPKYGPVFHAEVMDQDLALIKGLHVNFMRTAHYPNDLRTLRALERAGIMIAEEDVVYQWDPGHMTNKDLVGRAVKLLQQEAIRDLNRPGVVAWSVCNEIESFAPESKGFVEDLVKGVNEVDPDRPTMMAYLTLTPATDVDFSSGEVDIIGVNQYFGWYYGKTDEVTSYLTKLHERHPSKTYFISEYGADALQGRHLHADETPAEEPKDDHSYSEEFQVYYHKQNMDQFEKLDFIRGVMPWVLADFRFQWTPTTGKPHPVPLMNLKGLTSDQRVPKAAYSFIAQRFAEWRE